MKIHHLCLLALGLFTLTTSAFADWGRPGWGPRPPHGPGWGPRPPMFCSVTFQKCDFALNGICVKWNNKGFQVPYHEANWACDRAYREYGQIRNCYVSCR